MASFVDISRFKRISWEAFWILIGKIASILGSLILVRVLTEYLTPSKYGELALGLTIAGLINQLVMGGLIAGIGRFYSIAAEKGEIISYFHASRRLLKFATAIVVMIGLVLVAGLIFTGQQKWLALTIAALIFSIISGFNGVLNGVQGAARQRVVVALHEGLNVFLNIGLAIWAIYWLGESSTSVIVGYIFSACLVTVSQCFFLKRLIRFDTKKVAIPAQDGINEDWIGQIWKFSWPFSAWGLFTWGQQASDRWALEVFASTNDVGQYAVLFQFGFTPIALITGIMMTLIGPILYQRSGDATDHGRNTMVHRISWRITQISLLFTMFAFIFTWFTHSWLFGWLVAEAYRGVSFLLPWFVLAGGLFAGAQMLSLKLMSEVRSELLLPVKVGTALLGTSANITGAWLYGLNGVIMALVLFSLFYLVWMIFLAWRLPTG